MSKGLLQSSRSHLGPTGATTDTSVFIRPSTTAFSSKASKAPRSELHALRKQLRKCMESNIVQGAIIFVVALDIGLSIVRLIKLDWEIPSIFDLVVLIVLTSDILFRLVGEGLQFFCDRGSRYINIFELFVVAACWFDFFYDIQAHSSSLRLLGRAMRVVRPLALFCQQRKRLKRKAGRALEAKAFKIMERMIGDVLNLQKTNVKCKPFQGQVKIKRAEICSETFRELYLPITLVGGFVNRMEVCSPILDDTKVDVKVEIKDALLTFGRTELEQDVISKSKDKLAHFVAKKLDLMATTIQSNVVARYKARFKKRMMKQLMTEARIEIKNVTLRYEDSGDSFEPFACGVKLYHLSLERDPVEDVSSIRSSISGHSLQSSLSKSDFSQVDSGASSNADRNIGSDTAGLGTTTKSQFGVSLQKLRIHRIQVFWDMHPATRYNELFEDGGLVFPSSKFDPSGSIFCLYMASHYREIFKLALAARGFPCKRAMRALQQTPLENWGRSDRTCIPSSYCGKGGRPSLSPTDPTLRERFDHHSYVLLPVTMKVNIDWRAKARAGEPPCRIEAHISPIHLVIDTQQSKSFNCLVARIQEWFLEDDVRCTRPLKTIWKAHTDAAKFGDFFRGQDIARCESLTSLAHSGSNDIRHWWKYVVRFKRDRKVVEIDENVLEDIDLEYKDVVRQWWKHAVRTLQMRLRIKPDCFSQNLKEDVLGDIRRDYVKLLIESKFQHRLSAEDLARYKRRIQCLQEHLPVVVMLRLIRDVRDQTRKLLTGWQETVIEDIEQVNETAQAALESPASEMLVTLQETATAKMPEFLKATLQHEDLEDTLVTEESFVGGLQEDDAPDASWSHPIGGFVIVESLQLSILTHSLWGWLAVSVTRPSRVLDAPVRSSGFLKTGSRSSRLASHGSRGSWRQALFRLPSWSTILGSSACGPKPGGFGFERFRARVARRMVFVQALAVGIKGSVNFPSDFFKRNSSSAVATATLQCEHIAITNAMAPEALKEVCSLEAFEHDDEKVAIVLQLAGEHDPTMAEILKAQARENAEMDPWEIDTQGGSINSGNAAPMSPTPTRSHSRPLGRTATSKSNRSNVSVSGKDSKESVWSKHTARSNRSGRNDPTRDLDGETWKDALKEKCWVGVIQVAPIRLIHYKPMVEKLMVIARRGKGVSLAQEEFIDANGLRFRGKLNRMMFLQYLTKLQRIVKQRILIQCVGRGIQIETFHRFSHSKMCVTSSALPPARCELLWAEELIQDPDKQTFFTTLVEESIPSLKEVKEFLEAPFARISDVASSLPSFTSETFGLVDIGTDHEPLFPVWPPILHAADTKEYSSANDIDQTDCRSAGSCWCWRGPADFGSNVRPIGIAKQSSNETCTKLQSRAYKPSSFTPLPKPSCAVAMPTASFSSVTESGLWQVVPWQIHMRLVDASSLNLRVGNAATRTDDYAAVEKQKRIMTKANSGRFSYLGLAETVKQRLQLNRSDIETGTQMRGFQFTTTPEARQIRNGLLNRGGLLGKPSMFGEAEDRSYVDSQTSSQHSCQLDQNDFDATFELAPQPHVPT